MELFQLILIVQMLFLCTRKEPKRNVCNHRPISLLPLFSRVFEKLVYDSLYNHVRNTISGSHHGFVKCRSTVSNLACYLDSISEAIDNKQQVDSVYLDFSKASNSVCHSLTINSQA